jgi:hypothetical protein
MVQAPPKANGRCWRWRSGARGIEVVRAREAYIAAASVVAGHLFSYACRGDLADDVDPAALGRLVALSGGGIRNAAVRAAFLVAAAGGPRVPISHPRRC